MVLKIVPFDFVFVVVVRSNSLENVDHARLSLAIKKNAPRLIWRIVKALTGCYSKEAFFTLENQNTCRERGPLLLFKKREQQQRRTSLSPSTSPLMKRGVKRLAKAQVRS